jgi:type IV secretory pathway VirB3-like protein
VAVVAVVVAAAVMMVVLVVVIIVVAEIKHLEDLDFPLVHLNHSKWSRGRPLKRWWESVTGH